MKVTIMYWAGPREVEAEEIGPGLALHRAYGLETSDQWSITHVSSGLALGNPSTRKRAEEIGKALATLGDWTRSKGALLADKEFVAKVRKLVDP